MVAKETALKAPAEKADELMMAEVQVAEEVWNKIGIVHALYVDPPPRAWTRNVKATSIMEKGHGSCQKRG